MVIPHTLVAPVIATGVAGAAPVTNKLVPGMLPQAFTAETPTFPAIKVVPKFTVIELLTVDALVVPIKVVPAPPTMVTPAGTVHKVLVAPNTGATEYVAVPNPQAVAGPDIEPGTAGFLVTCNIAAALVPQLLPAVTVTSPITVPAVILTVIAVVPCPPVIVIPVVPVGTVQV